MGRPWRLIRRVQFGGRSAPVRPYVRVAPTWRSPPASCSHLHQRQPVPAGTRKRGVVTRGRVGGRQGWSDRTRVSGPGLRHDVATWRRRPRDHNQSRTPPPGFLAGRGSLAAIFFGGRSAPEAGLASACCFVTSLKAPFSFRLPCLEGVPSAARQLGRGHPLGP
jgi:hypothetical protein